jgi:hypothetical protein
VAHHHGPQGSKDHYDDPPAVACPKAQPGGEHLAVPAPELALPRVFDTYEEIIDAACDAWRKLIAQPGSITSIGMREWAHTGQK